MVKYDQNDVKFDDTSFYLFAASILLLITVPILISKIWRFVKNRKLKDEKLGRCACTACNEKEKNILTKEQKWSSTWFSPSNIFLVIALAALAYLVYEIIKSESIFQAPFDPFDILGIPESATDKDIKNAYKKLSLVYHPDRRPNDPSAADTFVLISKAYQALTDEVARENYRLYGHPDGRKAPDIGIALPTFMENRGSLVLMIYLGSLIIVLPTFMVLWRRSQQHKLQNSINVKTYRLFGEVTSHTGRFKDLLSAYATAFEFENLGSEARKFAPVVEELKRIGKFELKKMRYFKSPVEAYMVQDYLLLSAYFAGVEMPTPFLKENLETMLRWSEKLIVAMADSNAKASRRDCRAAYRYELQGYTSRIMKTILLGQCLSQGVNEKESVLLQLPGFGEDEVKYCNSRRNGVKTVYDLAALDNSARRGILRSFTDQELFDVNEFCLRYPKASLEVGEPRVDDESDSTVREMDKVLLDVKLNVSRGAGSSHHPCVRKLPMHKSEIWWVILADQTKDVPLAMKRLQPGDADENGNYAVELSFVAPTEGSYDYVVHALCDCYIGCDLYSNFRYQVLPAVESTEDPRYFDSDDDSEGILFAEEESEAELTDCDDYEEETEGNNTAIAEEQEMEDEDENEDD